MLLTGESTQIHIKLLATSYFDGTSLARLMPEMGIMKLLFVLVFSGVVLYKESKGNVRVTGNIF